MKTITVKLKIDPQKFAAAQRFMDEKGLDISTELSKGAEDFYKRYVPSAVRNTSKSRLLPPTRTPRSPSPLPPEGRQNPVHLNRILTRIVLNSALAVPMVPKMLFFGSAMRFSGILPKGFQCEENYRSNFAG